MGSSTMHVDRWRGYLPLASQALSELLEPAARGGRQFTAPERALFAACEFWVAVETRTLVPHLGAYAADSLRYLSIIYSAMGADHVARTLIVAVSEIGDAATSPDLQRCLVALQERVAQTQDPVDQLIAGLARDMGLSAIARPYRLQNSGAGHGAQHG